MSARQITQYDWNAHRRSGSVFNLDMWKWGWMQGEGELCLPKLGPCIGVVVHQPDLQLVVGGRFPARGADGRTEAQLTAMLKHTKKWVDLGAAGLRLVGGVLWPETGDDHPFSLNSRLEANVATREHREWVEQAVVHHLGDIPTRIKFYEHPVTNVHCSVDVATGNALMTLTTPGVSQ